MGQWQAVLLGLSAFVSTVAVLVAVGAYRVATRAARTADSYPQVTEKVIEDSRRIINQLKDEVESGIDKLEVYLGRISRMRRQDSPRKIDIDQINKAVAQLPSDDTPADGGGILQNTSYAAPSDDEGISPRQRLLRGR